MNQQDTVYSEQVRLYLEKEFENRSNKNPNYSLRAFAKSLNVDSSYLSKVLRNKRTLNGKALYSFLEKLNFPETLNFTETIRKTKNPNQTQTRVQFSELSVDEFKVIADWYHYAILEIIHLDSFKPDIKWIATELNVSYGEIYAAIHRLKRLGLLKIDSAGKWTSQPNTTTKNKFSITAFRTLQKQILNQALLALENTSIDERDQSSITMCIDKDRLLEAKEKIKKFRRDLMLFLEGGKNKDEIYHLSVSLFPVTQVKKKGNKNAI